MKRALFKQYERIRETINSNVESIGRLIEQAEDLEEFVEDFISDHDGRFSTHNFIIAGDSYGQGSSREHAALCPMFLGVKAVIAKSIERIHLANLINFGIIPFCFKHTQDYEKLDQGDRLKVEGLRGIAAGDGVYTLVNETQGVKIPLVTDFSKRQVEMLLLGGLLNYISSNKM